jgi:flavin reductase (DIM6/NTAB) family NADH-FMN oxidoreductase RutF
MAKRNYPLARVYGLLEPGPVILLTTSAKDRPNVMTLSWLTMVEFEPPLVACVLSNRDYSYGLLRKSGECGINIPTLELAEKVVAVGNSTGRDIDKFESFGLTAKPASMVSAPLIVECYANLECRVYDSREVARYGLFILEVVKAQVDTSVRDPKTLHHRGKGAFMVAGETIKLPSKMK